MFRPKTDLEKQAIRLEAAEYEAQFDDASQSAVYRFLRDRATRETFESILIAIILAMLFRNFLGEAYVIPTGSMAPGLMGRHIDVPCPKCGFPIRSGASSENNIGPISGYVEKVVCANCSHILELERSRRREHRSYSGDRILVNRFIYDFQAPNRWDVIVFKYPNNGKQNYVKRCVGLPGEGLLIENGDIYVFDLETETFADRRIARKDPEKLKAMLQLVHDTQHTSAELDMVEWPSHWQQWGAASPSWTTERPAHGWTFANSGKSSQMEWLGYRHCRPISETVTRTVETPLTNGQIRRTLTEEIVSEWSQVELGIRPTRLNQYAGELITDFYGYNESSQQYYAQNGALRRDLKIGESGLHWVGDLGLECDLEIKSTSGKLAFDAVEGGVHFTCTIDVSTGMAQLSSSDAIVKFMRGNEHVQQPPAAETPVKRPGRYRIKFVNADDRLYLYVNDRSIDFEVSEYSRSGDVFPKWTEEDPLDAQPLGLGTQGVEVVVNQIKVWRDVYYVSGNRSLGFQEIRREYPHFQDQDAQRAAFRKIRRILRTPQLWETEEGKRLFADRSRGEEWVFQLKRYPDDARRDEFLPMGDNSPESSDARVWDGPPHVDREMLLGRAMYVYWPHALNRPLPFWPNFERMKSIR